MSEETPTIRSLSSRTANKDARSAFNSVALMVAQLPEGNFAICDRAQNFYLVVDEPPDRAAFTLFSTLLARSRMSAEATYYGEPTDRELVRDIRAANRPPVTPRAPAKSADFGLDIL